MEVWLPYGDTEVCATLDTRRLLGILRPRDAPGVDDPRAEIDRALDHPIGSERLERIAKPGDRVSIAVDDHTRPTPSRLILPPVLERLGDVGVDERDVTVIFACGSHRPVRDDEAARILGKEVAGRLSVMSHDCRAKDLVHVGRTSLGTDVYVNRAFAEADVRILTGDVDLHYYAGYGGGRKSVLPGLAGYSSIQHNHRMLTDPNARMGRLEGNPIHEDMTEAARMAGVSFIVNVVTNSRGEIVRAFAGDLEGAFLEGVKLVDEMYRVYAPRRADIVLVSSGGAPYDINFYQATKGLDGAVNVVKRGGVVVLVAECTEGHGSDLFVEWMTACKTAREAERRLRRRFVLGGHKALYLLRALERAHIILVSALPDHYAKRVFRLDTARTVDEAMGKAFRLAGKRARVLVVPYGNATLPSIKR